MRLTGITFLDALCRRQACEVLAAPFPHAVVVVHDLLGDGLALRRTFRSETPAERAGGDDPRARVPELRRPARRRPPPSAAWPLTGEERVMRFHRALSVLAQGCSRPSGLVRLAVGPEYRFLLQGVGPRVWLENTGPWPVDRQAGLLTPDRPRRQNSNPDRAPPSALLDAVCGFGPPPRLHGR